MRNRPSGRRLRANSAQLAERRRLRESDLPPRRLAFAHWLKWLLLHIGIPVLAALASLWLAWSALSVEDPPGAPAVGFDVIQDETLLDFSFRTFAQRRAQGAVEPFRPADSFELAITADGCSPWVRVTAVVYADSRWWMAVRSNRLSRPFRPSLRFAPSGPERMRYGRAKTDGTFAFAVSGEIRHIRASTFTGNIPLTRSRVLIHGETVVEGRVPRAAVSRQTLINDFIAPAIEVVFEAPWVHDRVDGGCWISLPQLAGNGGFTLAPLGRDGLAGTNPWRLGPDVGVTSLTVAGGRVLRDESDPVPRQGSRPSWSCVAEPDSKNYLADRPTCAAAAAVAEPGGERQIQFRLLVGGGLLSASIVGAAAGVRRLLTRRPV